MTDAITILNAGPNYATRQPPAEIIQLASTNAWLKLHDSNETIFLRANTIQTISVWNSLPTHHGRIFQIAAHKQTRK